ncbi:MAG: zinc ribbon domain-containing protein [Nitrospiraceae bacterium]
MICPKCQFDQTDGNMECVRCGVIFAKFHAAMERKGAEGLVAAGIRAPHTSPSAVWEWVTGLVLHVEPDVNPFYLAGRAMVFAGLAGWSWKFIFAPMETNYVGESFMHSINLPFHEAGHLLFAPFGRFLQALGGTLGQLLMPLICAGAFLLKNRDPFGASVGLWWTAESFMDIAPYINDARALDLILLGGVTGKDVEDYHDWENILRTLGWLQYDHVLARASYNLGILLMLLALIWGGSQLYRQWWRLSGAGRPS